jgi:hypothetical protein
MHLIIILLIPAALKAGAEAVEKAVAAGPKTRA